MRPLLLQLLICLQITNIYTTTLTQNSGPRYIHTIPELAQVGVDPLKIDYLRQEQDGLIFEIKDTKVFGLKNLVIDELSACPNISMGRVLFHTDLLFTGLYKANGSMFFQPINGEGHYTAFIKNLEVELFVPYNVVKNENGVEFLDASKYNFRFDIKDNAHYHFDNLYYGNNELSELMHTLINFNWKFVTSQYSRIYISKVVESMASSFKRYFRLAPLKSLMEYQKASFGTKILFVLL